MFHPIRSAIADRMRILEELDARDRTDGTPRLQQVLTTDFLTNFTDSKALILGYLPCSRLPQIREIRC